MARKKIKNVILTNIYHYSLFLTLLYMDENEYDDTLFIIPKYYNKKGINKVNFSFKYLSILNNNTNLHPRIKSYIYILNNLYLRISLFIKRIFRYNTKNAIVFFNSIDHTVPVIFDFLYYKNGILMEDGLSNLNLNLNKKIEEYSKYDNNNIISIIYRNLVGTPSLKSIQKYITTKDIFFFVPVEIIDMQEKWYNASEYKKKFIFDFYNFDIDILKKYNSFSILCPQPLSEDNLISEEEKIDIYRIAIESIPKNEKIVIKPHPREKTDYTKIFPNAVVLSNSFPIELAKVSGMHFSKIYTVSSTVALNFPESEIVLIKVKQENLFQELIIKTLDNNGIKYTFI